MARESIGDGAVDVNCWLISGLPVTFENMKRREALAALAASPFLDSKANAESAAHDFLELKTWRFHNTDEKQASRVADYLQHGLGPALGRAGATLSGVFSSVIAPNSPFYITLTRYPSLASMQDVLAKLEADKVYQGDVSKLGSGPGLPFVGVESSLLRSFGDFTQPTAADTTEKRPPRLFELRTYQSQTFATLARKIGMFNSGEISIFERVGMRPIFFGETIVGPNQPNLTYMLSFDDLAAREKLWRAFGADPDWKKLRAQPGLQDSEIVSNISNIVLQPLTFSLIQ